MGAGVVGRRLRGLGGMGVCLRVGGAAALGVWGRGPVRAAGVGRGVPRGRWPPSSSSSKRGWSRRGFCRPAAWRPLASRVSAR